MKRSLLYFLITFSSVTSTFAQNRFTIHMRTPLEAKGAKLYVNIVDNDKRTILKRDSLVISNQLVEFSGILFQPSSFVNFYFKSKKLFISTLVVDTGNNEFVLTALPKLETPNS